MTGQIANGHLSQISTRWSIVGRAHDGSELAAGAARQELLDCYGGAVCRYLRAVLRDPASAEDMYQEFALRFLRGDFRRASQDCGRFRDFVKTALIRLAQRHQKGRQTGPVALEIDVADSTLSPSDEADREFTRSWRAELLARAWEALARLEEDTGRPFHQALRLRVEHRDLPSDQLADQLGVQLGKPVTAVSFRQTLHRARQAFADMLLHEVEQSLTLPTADEVARELSELSLLEYCRPALVRKGGDA